MLTWVELPVEYMIEGRSCSEDLEIRLNWHSYRMSINDEPMPMDSSRGMDLLGPSLEIVKDRASSLCLQAAMV